MSKREPLCLWINHEDIEALQFLLHHNKIYNQVEQSAMKALKEQDQFNPFAEETLDKLQKVDKLSDKLLAAVYRFNHRHALPNITENRHSTDH